ncbi:MAG: hypothetical protein R2756_00495 [Bacteroidales bacterium]
MKAEIRKITYLIMAIVMVAGLGSCEQDESEITLKKGDTGIVTPLSGSGQGITPVIIPGYNNGGNVTCGMVAEAFSVPAGYFRCGDKIDYNGTKFEGEFPDGLMVEVADGKYVSFSMEEPLLIDGKYYVVGAVIVKGGNKANVYFYPGGVMSDEGLCSPVNASGKPAGLSNLTFCLVESRPIVIALKTYLATPVEGKEGEFKEAGWAVSGGLGVSPEPGLHMGYNYYDFNGENEFDIVKATISSIEGIVGSIKAKDYREGDDHFLEVVLRLNDDNLVFANTYLYIGSLKGYEGRWFMVYPWKAEGTYATERVFKINFNEILL